MMLLVTVPACAHVVLGSVLPLLSIITTIIVHSTLTLPRYKQKFTAVCEEIFEFGLKEHEKREAEIASFFSCLEEATQDNNNAGVKHIHNYIEYKKKVSFFFN